VVAAVAAAGRISWVAPVARALLGARVGDVRRLRTPAGVEEIEVVGISYPEA
jgi:transcription elongation factor GreB